MEHDAKVSDIGIVKLLVTNQTIRRLRKLGEDVYYVTLPDGTSIKVLLVFERDGLG